MQRLRRSVQGRQAAAGVPSVEQPHILPGAALQPPQTRRCVGPPPGGVVRQGIPCRRHWQLKEGLEGKTQVFPDIQSNLEDYKCLFRNSLMIKLFRIRNKVIRLEKSRISSSLHFQFLG